MFRDFSLILRNAVRNRRRSALTVLSLTVSLCLFGVLMAMYRTLFVTSDAKPAQAQRLVVHHQVSITQPLPVSYRNTIARIPGVRDVMVWQWFGGTYKDARDARNFFARFAVEPDRLFGMLTELRLPDAERTAFQQQRTGCIVSRSLAAKFGWKPGERLMIVGDIFPVDLELTIVGVYTDPDDGEGLFFNYEYLRELLATTNQGTDQVGVLVVQTERPSDVPAVAAAIDKAFENSPAPTKSESERLWQLRFVSFLGDLKLFLLALSAALVFTMVLVSANTISMSVRERVREVGILKTLGFKPRAILWLVLGEAMLTALAGGICGLLLSAVVCLAVGRSDSPLAALDLVVTMDVAIVLMVLAATVGLVSALVPAWKASRMSVLQAIGDAG